MRSRQQKKFRHFLKQIYKSEKEGAYGKVYVKKGF